MLLEGASLPPSDNPPDWDKWLNIPNMQLFECVVLSLAIDPDSVELKFGSVASNQLSKSVIDELNNRLFVAYNNLDSIGVVKTNNNYQQRAIVHLFNFVQWAKSIKWAMPSRLGELFPLTSASTDSEKLLSMSNQWQKLKKIITEAIEAFPEWGKKQKNIQMTGNLIEWIKTEFKATTREAEIVKNILSDIYIESDKYQ